MKRRTNEDIRNELNVSKDWLVQYVTKQKLGYFGHIVRHDGMEKRVFEAYIPGKRNRGRPRSRWDGTVKEAFWINGEGNQIGSKTDRSFMLL